MNYENCFKYLVLNTIGRGHRDPVEPCAQRIDNGRRDPVEPYSERII